jgi:hypothetical protein
MMVELGRRVDVIKEASVLASQLVCCPRDRLHLEAMCSIFACLSNKHTSRVVFVNPTCPKIDMRSLFKECN